MSNLRNSCYYEFRTIDEPDKVVQEGHRLIGTTTITTGIDSVPTLTMTIPIPDLPISASEQVNQNETILQPLLQRYTVVVYFNVNSIQKYRFQGTIDKMDINYADYTVSLSLSHTVARMREWAMPVNYTVKTMRVEDVVSARGAALGYANPPIIDDQGNNNFSMQSYDRTINFVYANDGAKDVLVTMTFGANNKLEALSELLKNTEDLHFAVDLSKEEDTVIISSFTESRCSDVIVSPYVYLHDECDEEENENWVVMLTEPKFNVDYTHHFNRAIVFCGDIQDGVNHLTLEQYYSGALEPLPGFPVGKYEYDFNQQPEAEWTDNGKKINNEKIYKDFDIIAYSKNGNREFYVQDSHQLKQDSNIILNTVYNFNDLYPIPNLNKDIDDDGEVEELVITDGDRAEIVRQAYLRAVRKLRAQRPTHTYQMNTTALPLGVSDGTKVRFEYSKRVYIPDEECDTYTKRDIVNISACFYLTKRTITFDSALNEVTTITLDQELRPKDISATELELREDATSVLEEMAATHKNLGTRNYTIDVYNQFASSTLSSPSTVLPPNGGMGPD